MIRILAAAVHLEGMPHADRLLTIPGRVVQPRRRQDGVAWRHRRQVHVAVRVVALHRRRVRGARTAVAANESATWWQRESNGGITAEWRDILYDSAKKSLFVPAQGDRARGVSCKICDAERLAER